LDELAIFKIIKQDPMITQKELASKVGKYERAIKNKNNSITKKDTSGG